MRKGFGIVTAAGMLAALTAALTEDERVHRWVQGYIAPAQTAYVLLEASPGGQASFERAARLIQRARQREPRGSWVYIALAKASLAHGHREGSRFKAEGFAPGAVERARSLAARAVERAPEESAAHLLRARIALINERSGTAGRWLERAERLDPTAFRPHVFRSVLHGRAGEFAQARAALTQAERRREHPRHGRWLRAARSELAAAAHAQGRAGLQNDLQEVGRRTTD